MTEKIFYIVAVTVLAICVIGFYSKWHDCEAKGGVLMKTVFSGYSCYTKAPCGGQ